MRVNCNVCYIRNESFSCACTRRELSTRNETPNSSDKMSLQARTPPIFESQRTAKIRGSTRRNSRPGNEAQGFFFLFPKNPEPLSYPKVTVVLPTVTETDILHGEDSSMTTFAPLGSRMFFFLMNA